MNDASDAPVSDELGADYDVVVVGGGVAGLVAARECLRIGLRVAVLEAGSRVGGSVAPLDIAGVTVDAGAESFATRGGHVAALLTELGLADAIVAPNPRGSWLHLPDGRSVPSPKAGLLGIPSSPLSTDVRRVIGWGGAVRAYGDRLLPVLKVGRVHDLAALVEKRMGRAVLELLVAPVTSGVYSARADDLDVDLVAPGLNGALTRLGSLSGAVAELRAAAPAGAAVNGIDGGMHRLVDALVADIRYLGGAVVTRTTVLEVERAGESWSVRVARVDAEAAPTPEPAPEIAPELLDVAARAVVVAVPERQALAVLDSVLTVDDEPERPETDLVVELVTLVLDDGRLDAAPRGSGLLVVPGTPGVSAKALTHATAKWSWLADRVAAAAGRPGRHVLRLSYGRVGEAHPLDGLDDTEIGELALRDASTLLGIDLAAESVVATARVTWSNAVPTAAIGQKARIERFAEAVAEFDGLEAVGTWIAGTGLASVIPDARAGARRIRQYLVRQGVNIPREEYDGDDYA